MNRLPGHDDFLVSGFTGSDGVQHCRTRLAETVHIPLPAWADNDEARALLQSIRANPPERKVTRGRWKAGGGRVWFSSWKRPDVRDLKRIYKDWLDRQLAALDAQYEVTGYWPAHAASPFAVESFDELLGRLLPEELLTEVRGDPLRRVA